MYSLHSQLLLLTTRLLPGSDAIELDHGDKESRVVVVVVDVKVHSADEDEVSSFLLNMPSFRESSDPLCAWALEYKYDLQI